MRVYLSGRITGEDDFRKKFDDMEKRLRTLGYNVFNPAILPQYFNYEEFMAFDFMAVGFSDAIFLMDDWSISNGARLEKKEAERLGKKILYQKDIIYRETLLKLCDDTERLILNFGEWDGEEGGYNRAMGRLCSIVRKAVVSFNPDKGEPENLLDFYRGLSDSDRELFRKEMVKDGDQQIITDLETDMTDWRKRKLYQDMMKASNEMALLLSSEEERNSGAEEKKIA